MKKIFTWLFLMGKRQFKNPMLLILLIVIPIAALIVKALPTDDENDSYTVGVFSQGDDALSLALKDALVESSGTYSFVAYEDMDRLYRDVQNESIICGYILPDNLTELTSAKVHEECITSIHKPGITIQTSLNEIVYSNLIKLQGRIIISDYAADSGLFADVDTDYVDELMNYYEKYLASDVTFHMVYNTYGINGEENIEDFTESRLTFPIRGILAIVVYLAAMFGGILYLKDKEAGIFNTVSGTYKRLCLGIYTLLPTFVFALVCAISLVILGESERPSTEIAATALLILLSTLTSVILVKILRTSKTYAFLVPMILLCCLIICPVFIKMDSYIPAAKYIEKIFAPYYYLSMFT